MSIKTTAKKDKHIITNTGQLPALMLHLDLWDEDDEQILPVFFSENYFHLMPGESMPVTIQWNEEDMRGGNPHLFFEGFNVESQVF